MWYLVCPNKDGQSYRLTKDKDEHQVSRTTGDITLHGDQSVSRRHAKFMFETDKSGQTVVTVQDLESKYGTFINGSFKLEPRKPHKLADGDIITFGCQWNEWSFHSKPFVITTSTMPLEMKAKLRQIISELGGTLVGDWQETCTHLTMVEILLTAKVVCALASAAPIVTPDYWERFKEAIDGQKLPPNYEQFIPPLKESILNKNKVSFAINEKRKEIFSGKTFVFSSEKQLKKYKTIVVTGGGCCQALENCRMTVRELCGPDFVVMQHTSSTDSQPPELYRAVLREMRYKGLKPIPESEIGLAVLMCSLDMYCNMKYNVVGNVLEGGTVMSQVKRSEILADDSQISVIEPNMVKTEEPAAKSENPEVDSANANPVLSIMKSNSFSIGDTGSTGNSLNNAETLPCGFDQALPKSGISMDETASPSMAPGPSRKRTASLEIEEPPAKKLPAKGKAQELKEKHFERIEDILYGAGPSKSNKFSNGNSEKEDTPCRRTSKRKLDATDNSSQNGGSAKSGRIKLFSALFPGFGFGEKPSTVRRESSSSSEVEDDDQWKREGARGIKELLSPDWEKKSKWSIDLKDIGIGMAVKFANLVVEKKVTESPAVDSSIVNYKKFRKVKSVVSLPSSHH